MRFILFFVKLDNFIMTLEESLSNMEREDFIEFY